MNINIKITHTNGTVLDISIPVLTPETTPPAVVTPEEPQVASETAASSQDALSTESSNEQVVEFGQELLAHDTTGEKRVGEDVGIGRIGGMGERKDKGEGEGGEENRDLSFKCQDGNYVLPTSLYRDFCSAFGAPFVDRELVKARLWCQTNQQNRKKLRGMGRFLNAWLCRAQGEKRVPISQRTGSLLEASNPSQEGW